MQGWHSEDMSERIPLPDISEEVQSPLVKELWEIIERWVQRVRQQDQQIAPLKDEIAGRKGEKKRAQCKPSQWDKNAGQEQGVQREGKRPGSAKRSKTLTLTMHEEQVIPPAEPVPAGSRFKGYRD